VNTALPVWMPIEQIFVSVITAKARKPFQHPALGLDKLARSLAFRLTRHQSKLLF